MPVALPLVVVGVAFLCLLIALAWAIIITPILEGMARSVPVVGGYIARGIHQATAWAQGRVVGWANANMRTLARWLDGLRDSNSDFVDAVNRAIVDLPDQLQRLRDTTVPRMIENAIVDIRATAAAAARKVDTFDTRLGNLFTRPLDDFRGIEHGVDQAIDHALDVVRNVDLPDLQRAIEFDVDAAFGQAAGAAADVRRWAGSEFDQLWDQLGKLPIRELLDSAAAGTALALLVQTLARESGLDQAECRAKLRNVCATDPDGWAHLLETLALGAIAWGGLDELIGELQAIVEEVTDAIVDLVAS